LTVGLSVLLGTGFGAVTPGVGLAHGQDVIDDGNITEHRAPIQSARWGDQGGEQGEIESPRWGDQGGEKGEVEAPRWGDEGGEKGEVESPRA
jgi:hypothetical protein